MSNHLISKFLALVVAGAALPAAAATYQFQVASKGVQASAPPAPVEQPKTYAVLQAASSGTLSNGNLTIATPNNSQAGAAATIGKSSGKWYWEVKFDGKVTTQYGNYLLVGVASGSRLSGSGFYNLADGTGYFGHSGTIYAGGKDVATFALYAPGAVIGMALDMDANKITYYTNGVLQGTVNLPVTGQTMYPAIGDGTAGDSMLATANFGQTPFVYPVPAGYNAGVYTTP